MTERKSSRHPANIRVFFTDGTLEGEGTARDVSKHGCRVVSDTQPTVGLECEVWLFSPDFGWPLKVENAVVRWAGADAFGLEFLAVGGAQRERLRRLIAEDKLDVKK